MSIQRRPNSGMEKKKDIFGARGGKGETPKQCGEGSVQGGKIVTKLDMSEEAGKFRERSRYLTFSDHDLLQGKSCNKRGRKKKIDGERLWGNPAMGNSHLH